MIKVEPNQHLLHKYIFSLHFPEIPAYQRSKIIIPISMETLPNKAPTSFKNVDGITVNSSGLDDRVDRMEGKFDGFWPTDIKLSLKRA